MKIWKVHYGDFADQWIMIETSKGLTKYEKKFRPDYKECRKNGKLEIIDRYGDKVEYRNIGGCYLLIAAKNWEEAVAVAKKQKCPNIEVDHPFQIKGPILDRYEPSSD